LQLFDLSTTKEVKDLAKDEYNGRSEDPMDDDIHGEVRCITYSIRSYKIHSRIRSMQ
jgi:hypothetical protein